MRIQEITPSSIAKTITAKMVAVVKWGMRYGNVWPSPPTALMRPQTGPRIHGDPRPVREPSSERPSAKAIEIPAPTEAAMPTRNVCQVLWVAKAQAILPRTFNYGFATALMLKDVQLCVEQAKSLNVPNSVMSAVLDQWETTNNEFGGESDFTAIAKMVE